MLKDKNVIDMPLERKREEVIRNKDKKCKTPNARKTTTATRSLAFALALPPRSITKYCVDYNYRYRT